VHTGLDNVYASQKLILKILLEVSELKSIDMENIGLGSKFIAEPDKYNGLFAGRVVSQSRDLYRVATEYGEVQAEVSGRFRFDAETLSDFPAVGDFVMIDRKDNSDGNAVIYHVLPRKSAFIRRAAGTSNEGQVVASNIDTVFICMSLNRDFNLRRAERYLGIAWDSGAVPVIVLTKADLCDDLSEKLPELGKVALGVDVIVTSSLSDDGYEPVRKYLGRGKTIAFIGSSGVGKSTLINRLVGRDLFLTRDIRKDDRGRHTTTRRELIAIPGGGAFIDTPGMRELGIESADLARTFIDIDELSEKCRFHDCTHKGEPGCAVIKAISDGLLSEDRLESYLKLKKEARYEGMNSRQIETEKITAMFAGMGGSRTPESSPKKKGFRLIW
jgi:ribosome biogenesis GTPase